MVARASIPIEGAFMARAAETLNRKRRRAAPEERRLQLIRATIQTVADGGLSDVTVASVAGRAGLSQGIINLHFQSKERLLLETLRHVAGQYRSRWDDALSHAGADSATRLRAIIDVDFDAEVCDRDNLAVWFAFWGESKSRPTYMAICAERDRRYEQMMTDLCQELVLSGPYPDIDPTQVATGLYAMTEGLWLRLLINPESLTPDQARAIVLGFLARTFPAHFETDCKAQGLEDTP
jgi:TetR/AcrR family transcriptional repressor of bet genes